MESFLLNISIMLVPALLAVTLHEVAHGYVAERFGDPTARLLGRLTLNPLKHLDPIGTLALFVFGFGWARPIPVNHLNLRRPKQDMVWVSLSGPLTNFTLAALSAILLRLLAMVATYTSSAQSSAIMILEPLLLMAGFSLFINILLGFINILPIPPLDGGRVLLEILPKRQSDILAKFENFSFILIIFLFFFTNFGQSIVYPSVDLLSKTFAGHQYFVVERATHLLFGR